MLRLSAVDESPRRSFWPGYVPPLQPHTFADHLGTPLLQTDSSANVYWRMEQEPYGKVWALRAGDVHQPLRLRGQVAEQFDTAANGLTERSYNNFRWYRPGWGRYTQPDPIDLIGGVNLYGYAGNNSLRLTDPLGLSPTDTWNGGLSGLTASAYQYMYRVGALPYPTPPGMTLTNFDSPDARLGKFFGGLALGALLGLSAAPGELAGPTCTLYRSVSPAELNDLLSTGIFRSHPLAFETGKFFYPSLEQAENFTTNFPGNSIISVQVPWASLGDATMFRVGGEGPAFLFRIGSMPSGPIKVIRP